MDRKILDYENIPVGRQFVLAYGHFDLVHPGHVRYLKNARNLGSNLIVCIQSDEHGEGLDYRHTQDERARGVAELSCVDYVVPLGSKSLSEMVRKISPSHLIFGTEYRKVEGGDIKEAIDIQLKSGREVIYDSGANENTIQLFSKSERTISDERAEEFTKVLKRNSILVEHLEELIVEWREARVTVIGDAIIDKYIDCEALGISAEAPVLVVSEKGDQYYVGGAAIVAAHVATLGGTAKFISVTGDDQLSTLLQRELAIFNVNTTLIRDRSRETTLKTRFVVENQKVFRTSRLTDRKLNVDVEEELLKLIEREAEFTDVIIVSDFNYGVITDRVIRRICKLSEIHGVKIIADLQCSSQYGTIKKFKNFSMVCPNEKEARLALHDRTSGLEVISQKLLRSLHVPYLVLKLGAEGLVFYDANKPGHIFREAFPALSAAPVDVAGAGDSILAVFGLALATNQEVLKAAALATCVACEAVETMGNVPISSQTLVQTLRRFSPIKVIGTSE